ERRVILDTRAVFVFWPAVPFSIRPRGSVHTEYRAGYPGATSEQFRRDRHGGPSHRHTAENARKHCSWRELPSGSACFLKSTEAVRETRNINDDVICILKTGIGVLWEIKVCRFFAVCLLRL